MKFTKTHTQISKGIAILMMLYHHLYILPERINCEYFSIIDLVIPGAQSTIAVFCKLCVCIYVFLSGYGLYHSLKNKKNLFQMYKDVFFRAIKFWTTYIIIYILFVTIGMFNNTFQTDWHHFFNGLLGIDTSVYNNTWWFANAYITILFLVPLIVYLLGNFHWIKKCATLCMLPIFLLFVNTYIHFIGSNFIINYFLEYLKSYPLIFSLSIGIFCAKFSIYDKIILLFDKIKNTKLRKYVILLSMFFLLLFAVIFRITVIEDILDMKWDFIIAPLFIFAISTIIIELNCSKFFILYGHQSSVIWLTHAFLCYTYAQQLVFLPYYSELVFIWFAILSLITAYLVNLILVPTNNLLFSKNHTPSFNGYFCFYKKNK